MTLTPRENYLRMLNHEIPEYVPSSYDNFRDMVSEELLTPVFAPGGKVVTSFGVEYLGSPEFGYGATPNPNKIILPDITEWDNISSSRTFPTGTGKAITRPRKEGGTGRTTCCLSAAPIIG